MPVTASDDLERVADKLAELMSRQDPGSAPGDAMRWRPPLAEPAVAAWEAEHGVVLPEDYRAFITRVAGSGTRPFHGLRELGVPDRDNDLSYLDPGRPFPYTFTRPLVCDPADEAPYWDALERGEADRGWIPLCTEGCGMDAILVVAAADPEVRGTVWYFDLANDCGILPMVHPTTRRPLRFLEWLELWLDAEAAGELDFGGIHLVPPELFPVFPSSRPQRCLLIAHRLEAQSLQFSLPGYFGAKLITNCCEGGGFHGDPRADRQHLRAANDC